MQESIVIVSKHCPNYFVKETRPLPTNGDPVATWFVHLLKASDGKHGNENYMLRYHQAGQPKPDITLSTAPLYRTIKAEMDEACYNLLVGYVPNAVRNARQPTISRHREVFLNADIWPHQMCFGTWNRAIERLEMRYTEKGCQPIAYCVLVPRNATHPVVYGRMTMSGESPHIKISHERFFTTRTERDISNSIGVPNLLELLCRTGCLTVHQPANWHDPLIPPCDAKLEPRHRSVVIA